MKQIFIVQDALTNQFYSHGNGKNGWVDDIKEAMKLQTNAEATHVATAICEPGQYLQVQMLFTR